MFVTLDSNVICMCIWLPCLVKIWTLDLSIGEFFEDFSGKINPRGMYYLQSFFAMVTLTISGLTFFAGSVRQMLEVHSYDIVDIEPLHYPKYEVIL